MQNVTNWERSINAAKNELICDLHITGSNSKLLSGELATLIAGRYIEIKVYPFSYKEVLEYKRLNNKGIDENKAFNEYVNYGEFPQIYDLDMDNRIACIHDISDSIVLKDIIQKNEIRNIDLLDMTIDFLIDNTGQTFSSKNISNYLKHEKRNMSRETLYNYIQYCIDSCFINKARRIYMVGKRLMSKQEKYYLTDHSFKSINSTEDTGQILENIVYIELLRRGYDVKVGKNRELEVDFICSKNKHRIYMQVAYLLADEDIVKREK